MGEGAQVQHGQQVVGQVDVALVDLVDQQRARRVVPRRGECRAQRAEGDEVAQLVALVRGGTALATGLLLLDVLQPRQRVVAVQAIG